MSRILLGLDNFAKITSHKSTAKLLIQEIQEI